jgi:hypothetical protein
VSIPDPFKIFFIHLAIVFAVTGPCGGLTLTHNLWSSEPELKATVASIKVLMVSTGHNSKLENVLIEKEPNGPAR